MVPSQTLAVRAAVEHRRRGADVRGTPAAVVEAKPPDRTHAALEEDAAQATPQLEPPRRARRAPGSGSSSSTTSRTAVVVHGSETQRSLLSLPNRVSTKQGS